MTKQEAAAAGSMLYGHTAKRLDASTGPAYNDAQSRHHSASSDETHHSQQEQQQQQQQQKPPPPPARSPKHHQSDIIPNRTSVLAPAPQNTAALTGKSEVHSSSHRGRDSLDVLESVTPPSWVAFADDDK